MKKHLIFATNNNHKLEEVRNILGNTCRILSLKEIDCLEEIPETADTLEGNALLKARFVKANYGFDCFSDDTGLEVRALNNAPGVHSARYAGETRDPKANMRKVLKELEGKNDYSARFRTVIALIMDGNEYFFEGIINGNLITEERGTAGFGYDPVFVPEGYSKTFAELGTGIKNTISHRAKAIHKLKLFLDEEKSI